jgi:hypothetical protein
MAKLYINYSGVLRCRQLFTVRILERFHFTKLIIAQSVMKFSSFHAICIFVTLFIGICHWSVAQA